MKLVLLFAFLLPMSATAATVNSGTIVLLQPDAALQEKQPDISAVASYIKTAKQQFGSLLASASLPKTSGFIVFAVRAGHLSNAWLDFEPALPSKIVFKGARLGITNRGITAPAY